MIVKINDKPRVYRFRIFLYVDTFDSASGPNKCPKRILSNALKNLKETEHFHTDYFYDKNNNFMIIEKKFNANDDIIIHIDHFKTMIKEIFWLGNNESIDYEIRIKRIVFDSFKSDHTEEFYQEETTDDFLKNVFKSDRLVYKTYVNMFDRHDRKHVITILPDKYCDREEDEHIIEYDFDDYKEEFFNIISAGINFGNITKTFTLHFC